MIGRKVESPWHRLYNGIVVRWEPLGTAMCDVLVRREDGSEAWYSSTDLRPVDQPSIPLSSRLDAQEQARLAALASLRAIRAQHVRDFNAPWHGMEHGKAIVGQAIDAAIAELAAKSK